MFAALVKEQIYPDLYFIDGRLQQEDAELLMKMEAGDAIFLIDDFVGTEKGVANAFFYNNCFPKAFDGISSRSRFYFELSGLRHTRNCGNDSD